MTTASHGPSDGHGDDHASDFDGEPTQELAPGEPRTPGWLPAVGLALFLAGGVAFLTMSDDAAASPAEGAASAAPAAAAAPPAAAAGKPSPGVMAAPLPRPGPQILPNPAPPPADPGAPLPPALAKLSPEQRAELQRQLAKARPPSPPPAH